MLDRMQLIAVSKQLFIWGVLCLVMSGCASNIVVKADIPAPLVQKLPLTGSMRYTDQFKNYVYLEAEKKRRALRSLDLAAAQTSLFDRVFGSLITLVSADTSSKDLIIEPEILDFQYTAPAETKLKQYEIWIKYRLKLRNKNSEKLADWTIKGYGKTPTGTLTSASSAFNSAATVALRDVGAQLSIRFGTQKIIKQLLAGDTPQPIFEEVEEPEEPAETRTEPKAIESAQAEPAADAASPEVSESNEQTTSEDSDES